MLDCGGTTTRRFGWTDEPKEPEAAIARRAQAVVTGGPRLQYVSGRNGLRACGEALVGVIS
jgi:hypothetical protein